MPRSVFLQFFLTRLRVSALPALRDEGGVRPLPDALHRLLVALPVDGGDGGSALQLEFRVLYVFRGPK